MGADSAAIVVKGRPAAEVRAVWQAVRVPGVAFVKLMAAADVLLENVGVLPKLEPNPSPDELEVLSGESAQRSSEAKDVGFAQCLSQAPACLQQCSGARFVARLSRLLCCRQDQASTDQTAFISLGCSIARHSA